MTKVTCLFNKTLEDLLKKNTSSVAKDPNRDYIRRECIIRYLEMNHGRGYEGWLHGYEYDQFHHDKKFIGICKNFEKEDYSLRQSLILTAFYIEGIFKDKRNKQNLIMIINEMLDVYDSMIFIRTKVRKPDGTIEL